MLLNLNDDGLLIKALADNIIHNTSYLFHLRTNLGFCERKAGSVLGQPGRQPSLISLDPGRV